MKKMLLATALALAYYRMCSTDVYCSKQTGSSSNSARKLSPIISSFLNWAEENCRCSQKICGGAENVVKNRNPANIRKWIARFYYFRHLYWKRVCIAFTYSGMSCPSIRQLVSALLINILRSFQLFFA